MLLDRLADDIRARVPALILVDTTGGPALPAGFRIDEWLEASGFLSREMVAYAMDGYIEGFDVWRRSSAADPARSSSPTAASTPTHR